MVEAHYHTNEHVLTDLTKKMIEVLTKTSAPTQTSDTIVAPIRINLEGTNCVLWS